MKSVEEITAVNVFNPNVRKIRCVENEHDYLGDGTVLCEYNLEKGKIYTFIRGEMKSYGAMVFLKEVSSQYGFQAYLFEELEPYNKQIAAEAYGWSLWRIAEEIRSMNLISWMDLWQTIRFGIM